MIRPLYRWKSFWFGVLVIAFLGWAWVRSMRNGDPVRWTDSNGSFLAANASGMTGFRHFSPEIFPVYLPGEGLAFESQSASPWLAPPWEISRRTGTFAVSVAHWFLILLFLVPWSGWLAWRWRRVKRLVAAKA